MSPYVGRVFERRQRTSLLIAKVGFPELSIRRGNGVAVALAGALLLSACGSDSNNDSGGGSGSGSDEPIVWGMNAEMSGPLALYGNSMTAGVQAYIDEVNADGGIDGRKIELTTLDNAGDQARAAANATQLATADKASAMFGMALGATCAAAQPVVERYKVPLACLSAAVSSPYIFSLGPDNGLAYSAVLETAKKVSGKDQPKAAVLIPSTLTGAQLKSGLEKNAEDAGVSLATMQEVDVTAADVSAQVSAIVASKPDVAVVSHTGPGFLSVLRGVRAAGLQVPVIWVDGTANLPAIAEANDQNVYAMAVHQRVDPAEAEGAAAEFLKAIKPAFDEELTSVNANGGDYIMAYSTARAFGEAQKECGGCVGEKFQAQLEKTSIELPGILPTFGYTSKSHYPYKSWFIYKVVGTETELVATFDADSEKVTD